MQEALPGTLVNHAAADIACPADAVWQALLAEYVHAGKFREHGYAVEELEGPEFYLGGYRLCLEKNNALLDERICRVTELDDVALRLSLCAEYLTVPGGLVVYATYQATPVAGGARCTIDCHSHFGQLPEASADRGEAIAGLTKQFQAGLVDYLTALKTKLEI